MFLRFSVSSLAQRCIAPMLASLLLAATAHAQQLLPEQSNIEFVSKQMGVPVSGKFTRFEGDIEFDPEQPEAASIELRIDIGSATLGMKEVDVELPKPEWFHAAEFPQAVFTSSDVKSTGDGQYEVSGELRIKGQSQAVIVPVSLERDGDQGTASGEFTIERLVFGIGDGDWADTSMVADEVQVRFKLALDGM